MDPVGLVDAVERATPAAVPPDAVEDFDGWLLPLDGGTLGHAHSAAPKQHRAPALSTLPAFEAVGRALRERGYAPSGSPVRVMLGTPAAMALAATPGDVVLRDAADNVWARIYLGEGFDPVDGASRVRLLRRARDAACASVAASAPGSAVDEVAAVGCACFAHGLVGVHGMRTRPAFRRRGLARRLLAAMGQAAVQRGIEGAFLQVEADNQLACTLYERCGFAPAWSYGDRRAPVAGR